MFLYLMFVVLHFHCSYSVPGLDVTGAATGTAGSTLIPAVVITPVNTNQMCTPVTNGVALPGYSPLTVRQPPPDSTTVVGGPVPANYYTTCSYVTATTTPTVGTYFTTAPQTVTMGLVYNGYVLASLNQGVVNFGPNVCSSGNTAPTQLQQLAVGQCTPAYAGINVPNPLATAAPYTTQVGSTMFLSFNAGSVGSGYGAYTQAPIGKTGIYGVSNQYVSANYYASTDCSGTPLVVYTYTSNAALCQTDISQQPIVVAWSATPYQLPPSLTAVVVST